MIENDLGIKLGTHHDRTDNRVFSPNLPNTNGLTEHCECNSSLVIVLIVYSFTVLELKSFFLFRPTNYGWSFFELPNLK